MIKKKRQYYYQTDFAVDEFSMRSIKVLQLKFSRDYMKFFKTLQAVYGPRQRAKTEINDAIIAVEKLCGLLDGIITSGIIGKDDAKQIYDLVEAVEAKKQKFLENVNATKSLQKIMESTSGKIGISPEDLNVTKGLVKKYVSPAVKRGQQGTLEYLQHRHPNLYSTGSELTKGFGAALLGPMYPLAEKLFHIGRELPGFGRTVSSRFGAGSSVGSAFAPISDRRGGDSDRRGFGGVNIGAEPVREGGRKSSGKDIGVETLRDFYNKDAYKARYTKETLNVLKEKRKETSASGKGWIDDIKDAFGLMVAGGIGGALTTLLSNPLTWEIGALAVTAAIATINVAKAIEGAKQLKEGNESINNAFANREDVFAKLNESIRSSGPLTLDKAKKISANEREIGKAHYQSQAPTNILSRWWWDLNEEARPEAHGIKGSTQTVMAPGPTHRTYEVDRKKLAEIYDEERAKQILLENKRDENAAKAINEQIGGLIGIMKKQMEKYPSTMNPKTIVVNPHMSGDTLMQLNANGDLSLVK